MSHFSDLGLPEVLLRALKHEGYDTPTPIQAKSIPSLLQGRDLLGIAQTGTGKTAAFALPIISRLIADRQHAGPRQVRALILAPTRELATQIAESFKAYGRFAKISVAVVIGGVSMGAQVQAMAGGLDVLVATPGRLLDHMQQGKVKLDMTEIVVLDEADHMLDLGFIVPIRQILAKTPKNRQSLFFSATMPKEIAGLANDMLRDPVQVAVTPAATTVERIAQEVFFCDSAAKRDLLVEILKDPKHKRTLVFTRTKRGADKVAQHLAANGITADAIHGNKSQGQRQRALDGFKSGRTRVLVATDIAARGIDVDGVSHVVNYELPEVPEAYVHRIGRTARAGADGAAVSFCDNSERNLLRAIEKTTRQSIPSVDRRGSRPEASVAAKPQPNQKTPYNDERRGRNNRNQPGRGGDQRKPEQRKAGGHKAGPRPGGEAGRSASAKPQQRSGQRPAARPQ